MVGIVIVSHSHRIAEGVAELAREMGGPDVRLETAGGLDMPDHPIGTDAVLVMAAIDRAWSDDGVLVLMDLGSAVLSAEMAIDLMPEDRRSGVLLCEAPIVEGAVAAAVTAKMGASLERVAQEARGGLAGKIAHLGDTGDAPEVTASGEQPSAARRRSAITLTVNNPHGLHARPAARFVQTASSFDARVMIRDLTNGRGPADAASLNGVAMLGATQGHEVEVGGSAARKHPRHWTRSRRSPSATSTTAPSPGPERAARRRVFPEVAGVVRGSSRLARDRDRPRQTVPNARSRRPRRSRRASMPSWLRSMPRSDVGDDIVRQREHVAGTSGRRRGGDLRRPPVVPERRRAPVPDQACDRRRWRLGRASVARRDRAHGEALGRAR